MARLRRGTAASRVCDTTLREDDLLTLDGNEGRVYGGAAQTQTEYPVEPLARLESLTQPSDGQA